MSEISEKMGRYNLYLPTALVAKISKISRDLGIPRSVIIRLALERWLQAREKNPLLDHEGLIAEN